MSNYYSKFTDSQLQDLREQHVRRIAELQERIDELDSELEERYEDYNDTDHEQEIADAATTRLI